MQLIVYKSAQKRVRPAQRRIIRPQFDAILPVITHLMSAEILKSSGAAFCLAPPVGGLKKQNISETTWASNFKCYHNVALNSLYISTGNYVIIYFRSAVNRINVPIWGDTRVAISR